MSNTLDLIQQMYNILVLSMSSRTFKYTALTLLGIECTSHDKFSHLSCLTPEDDPP